MADRHEAGLTRAVVPKRFGGYGLDPLVLYDAQLEFGGAGAATAVVDGVRVNEGFEVAPIGWTASRDWAFGAPTGPPGGAF